MNEEKELLLRCRKSNENSWSLGEFDECTPFTTTTNNQIECTYQSQQKELIIDENHKIDLMKSLEINVHNLEKQRPIRRCSNIDDPIYYYRRERFNFSQPIRRTFTDDTLYYGSSFISDWLIIFTDGKLKIKFSSIINALINGIEIEGQKLGFIRQAQDLIEETRAIKKKKIEILQQCCARLYSKPCFLFKIVNQTLRDNDQSKLETLGPFCYLLYNYIGTQPNQYLSIPNQLKHIIQSKKHISSMIVYRGEKLSLNEIEIYKQAVKKDDHYKWSSFISTSKSRQIAEIFGSNILYIIKIEHISYNDQYVDISSIAYIEEEQEILFKPGVRFKIDNYDYDSLTGRHIFHIQIVPSFISNIV